MDDEVDRLVRGWRQGVARGRRLAARGALPGVTVWPAISTGSGPSCSPATISRSGVSTCSRRCAAAEAPAHLSPGQLLAQTLVSSGTMTNRLDHLESRALVRRRPDPSDARSVRVQITAAGRRRVDGALADLVEREEAILASLVESERTVLSGLLRRVVAPFDV